MNLKCGMAQLMSTASLLVVAHSAAAAAESGSGAPVSEVVVTAPRQEVKARIIQLKAPNLIAVQAADTILKYPDYNAAEALGRMPGISLSSDTGEGRFVQIRGIDANLDGATYGGVPLLNTNPGGTAAGGGGRAVEYDTIPTGAIDGIVVTYTLLPDHEAEGLGGTIELSPRTAADVTKPFFEGTLGWGYEPLHDHSGPFEADVAMGGRFGISAGHLVVAGVDGPDTTTPRAGFISNPMPFSLVLYGSTKQDRRAIDDLEESYVDDGIAPSNAVSEYSLRRYDYHRRRFSFGGDFEFQPNDDHTYYVRANEAGYTESVHKNILDDEINNPENTDGGPILPISTTNANAFLVTEQPLIQLTDEEETHRNQVYSLGGLDRWGNTILDYHFAYSRATFTVHHSLVAKFVGPTVPFTYDNVAAPNYPAFTYPGGFDVNDPSQYALDSAKNERDVDTDEEFSYAVNLVIPTHLINDDDRIKIGSEVRLRDKAASEFDTEYDNLPDVTLATPGYSSQAISYYNGHYTTGPEINAGQVATLVNSNAVTASTSFNPGSYIAARENIFAGYAEYYGQVGAWGFLAGVRVEATDAKYGGYVGTTDVNGDTINALQFRADNYVNAFPTVQLRYNFTPTALIRATYSTGIGRPGFEQNTTAASVDYSQGAVVVINRGNPNLKPTLGNDFDLSFEDYLPNGGILQAALFDKEFSNYIAPRIQNGVTNDPLAPGQLADVTTYVNIASAYARGFTLAYHQKLTFLPKALAGLGAEANFTYVDSRFLEYDAATSLTGQNEYGMLPGTSPYTWNLALFYEAHGVSVRLAGEYIAHSLFGLSGSSSGGGDKSLDDIQDSRFLLDLTSSYTINKHWTVYFDAKNLTNQPLRYYEGSVNRPIQREFYDPTYEGGIRFVF